MTVLTPLALVRKLEYSLLEPQRSRAEIEAGCVAAVSADCYAVIVKPHYVEFARKVLKDSGVKVASVVGFPHGSASTATKMYATADIYQRGADEIVMVMNLGALRDGDDLVVHNDIATVVRTARGRPVTVIVELVLLDEDERERACKIADSAGASFLQTGTGFASVDITPADLGLVRIASPRLQIIAAGGITSLDDAISMIEVGASRVVMTPALPHTP